MRRFDYAEFDAQQQAVHNNIRSACELVEQALEPLESSREKSLALTKLEEAYMWAGKASGPGGRHHDQRGGAAGRDWLVPRLSGVYASRCAC